MKLINERGVIMDWKILILSIFYVIISVLSNIITFEQLHNFFMIAGIVLSLVGLFQMLVYFFKKNYLLENDFSFSLGVLFLIGGIIVALKPDFIVMNYPIALSVLVVLDSVLRLQYAMNLLRLSSMKNNKWFLILILAFIPLVWAMIMILSNLDFTQQGYFLSALLIVDAIANFITVFYYKSVANDYAYVDRGIFDNKIVKIDED